MDIDFSFWLTLATLTTGFLWLLELFLSGRASAFWKRFAAFIKIRRQVDESALNQGMGQKALGAAFIQFPVVQSVSSLFPVFFVVLFLRSFLVEPFQIPSASMVPTLVEGDFILVNKFTYGVRLPVIGTRIVEWGAPERGDVMVFIPPHDSRYFIKRVVGLPGDRVAYRNQRLMVNGKPAETKLIGPPLSIPAFIRTYEETLGSAKHQIKLSARGHGREGEWIVPEGHYFAMGDNRDASEDSRYWGFIPEDNVSGKAFAVWMHKETGWHWPSFSYNRLIQ